MNDRSPSHTASPEVLTKGSAPTALIVELCHSLEAAGIAYCHWKSNAAIARSESGENDLDLLVGRSDLQHFREILNRLGFKECLADPLKALPGVQDYIGYDPTSDRLIHVHAHFQLILGHDLSKNYHLLFEKPYLESACRSGLFKLPAPEFELIVFVIRMVIKHSTWYALLFREGKLSKSERAEYTYLLEKSDMAAVAEILKIHLPFIDRELFKECLGSFQPDVSALRRIRTGRRVLSCLSASSRRTPLLDLLLKIFRWIGMVFRWVVLKQRFGFRLANGGAIIAILGGDGAGKTTAVDELRRWFSQGFDVKKIHMGKPPWSFATLLIRTILKIGRTFGLYPFMKAPIQYPDNEGDLVFPGYPWLIREVLTARDRYLTYVKARRYANNGRLVLSDRFPLPGIRLMDGPLGERMARNQPPSRMLKKLIDMENRYYTSIQPPEIIVVLKADPDIAVQRKTDEDPLSVHARSKEIWEMDWSATPVIVIDANHPLAQVLSDLKREVWSAL